MARAELLHLRSRYRRVLHKRYRDTAYVLHWQMPGRVWALDFAEPSELGSLVSLPPVDGVFAYLLAVRDLASGYILAWLPLLDVTAGLLLPVLRQLFSQHGPPLVMKWDNGSAFRAEAIKALLEETGVIPLYSPPQWPRYNGAIEAGIGSLKTRTELHAARQGNPSAWTSDDLAAAVFEANSLVRYRGRRPADVWSERTPIRSSERASFQLATERHRFIERTEQKLNMEEHLDHWRESALDRNAVRRALVEHGYLLFRRRRLPPLVRGTKMT
jgi:transposase InsO family protein